MNFFIAFLILFSSLLISKNVMAEPWISNRFAQNCAGCHAPGRLNLPAKKRRCTLTCQGCHVNPNGGGLRNEYGKWTQQRWLKTFRIKKNKFDKNAPAPDFAQGYVQHSKNLIPKKFKKKKKKLKTKTKKRLKLVKKGNLAKMYTTTSLDHKEELYDNQTYLDWKIDAKSRKHFLSRVPLGDPYRLERALTMTGGADLRYFYGQTKLNHIKNSSINTRDLNLLMNVDLGLRIKPTKEHLSLVFENRFSGIPGSDSGLLDTFNISKVRSAYVLSDNWLYNTWYMAGIYRPHFGLYTPDHTDLKASITGVDQNSSYKAIGFGLAPNVPFINMHYILKKDSDNDSITVGTSSVSTKSLKFKDETGFNVNVGARFVTLGLSGKLSYWSTKTENDLSRTMFSASGGVKYKRFIGNIELLRWTVKDPKETAGSITYIDTKFRLWRENYFSFTTSNSNTTITGTPGSATEYTAGLRSYLFSGVKLDIMYKSLTSDYNESFADDPDINTYFVQLHTYF